MTVLGSVLALLLHAGHKCRQRLNCFLLFSQRKTVLSSRDELEGSVHVDISAVWATCSEGPVAYSLALWTGLGSKALRAGVEMKNLEFYFSLSSKRQRTHPQDLIFPLFSHLLKIPLYIKAFGDYFRHGRHARLLFGVAEAELNKSGQAS